MSCLGSMETHHYGLGSHMFTNFGFTNDSPCFEDKKKFTIHLSVFNVTIYPVLFMILFTPNFCLFKGGCPLYLKQVLVVLSSGLLS